VGKRKEVVTVKSIAAGEPDIQMNWADIVLMHNNEFNPTGVPHKAKRQADSGVAELQAITPPAVQLLSDPAMPGTIEEIVAQNLGVKVETGSAVYSLVVTKPGGVLIYAEEDGTVPHDEALFVVRGNPKTNEAAKTDQGFHRLGGVSPVRRGRHCPDICNPTPGNGGVPQFPPATECSFEVP
jgi:hypothetical protein